MLQKISRGWSLICVSLLLLGLSLGSPLTPLYAQPGDEATFSGRAIALSVNVLDVKSVFADTGELPCAGGFLDASLPTLEVPELLSATTLSASATGGQDRTDAIAFIGQVELSVGKNGIFSESITSKAAVSCTPSGPFLFGRSEIQDLLVNNTPITITGEPNQTVELPFGTLIINEQQISDAGDEITVNALHLISDNADIVFASSRAGIDCEGDPNCGGKK